MVVVLTAGGEQDFQTYGTGPGHPKQFWTKAACERVAAEKIIEFALLYPEGVIVKSGCAKLKTKWDA